MLLAPLFSDHYFLFLAVDGLDDVGLDDDVLDDDCLADDGLDDDGREDDGREDDGREDFAFLLSDILVEPAEYFQISYLSGCPSCIAYFLDSCKEI